MTDDQHFTVSPDQMMPPIASQLWPEVVPTNAISIITGITSEGYEALYLLNSTNTPPWVILGLLQVAASDIKKAWEDGSLYNTGESEDDDDEEE